MHLLWRRRARAGPPRVAAKTLDTIIAFYGSLKGFAPQTSTSQVVPVITSEHTLALMHWGLVPYWARAGTSIRPQINARAEGIESKATFRKAFTGAATIRDLNSRSRYEH